VLTARLPTRYENPRKLPSKSGMSPEKLLRTPRTPRWRTRVWMRCRNTIGQALDLEAVRDPVVAVVLTDGKEDAVNRLRDVAVGNAYGALLQRSKINCGLITNLSR